MGVKGLFPYLRKHIPECIISTRVEALRGKRIVLDGNLLLFREFASPWLGAEQPSKHILWSLRLVRLCKKYEIYPIVVFDSAQTTPAKARERVSRSLKRARNLAQLRGSRERASRLSGLSSTISDIKGLDVEDHRQVLTAFRQASDRVIDAASHKPDFETGLEVIQDYRSSGTNLEHTFETAEAQKARALLKNSEQIANLANRLTSSLESILNSPSVEASVELEIFLKLTASVATDSSNDELRALQVETALLVERLTRRTVYPKYSEIRKAALQLRKFGVPVQISPDHYEGECTAALFVRSGFAELVASEDSDVLVYGVPQLRGFMSLRGSRDDSMSLGESKVIYPDIIRQQLTTLHKSASSMTETQFIDLAILCGTDFTKAIAQHGISKSVAKIMAFGSIEASMPRIKEIKLRSGVRRGINKYHVHDSFEEDVAIARQIFQSYPTENKMIRHELRSVAALNKAFARFERLCVNEQEWDSVENQVLAANGLTRSDIAMLDNPELYKQHKLSDSARLKYGLHDLQDGTEQGSTDRSSHGLHFL